MLDWLQGGPTANAVQCGEGGAAVVYKERFDRMEYAVKYPSKAQGMTDL